jgi:hypothetical protein
LTNFIRRGGDIVKKTISIIVAAALVLTVVTGAIAFGPGTGMGRGYGMGHDITPEDARKFAEFQKEILPLRQKMLQLRTELMTIRTQTPVNWDAVAAKKKEMVDVKTEIQKKAAEAGITKGFGPGACRGGMGKGMMGMGRL